MFENPTLIIDGGGENVKIAEIENGELARESVSGAQAIESVANSMRQFADNFGKIKAYAVCSGPGSMLGTRFASVYASTLAKLNDAEIFEWDIMQTAAFWLFDKFGDCEFSLAAPSRKGCVNLLNFKDGKIESQNEYDISLLDTLRKNKTYQLHQRQKVADEIAQFEKIDLTPKQIFETLKKYPELLNHCDFPPDAKSLSKREYVKWKAQAHI